LGKYFEVTGLIIIVIVEKATVSTPGQSDARIPRTIEFSVLLVVIPDAWIIGERAYKLFGVVS
jgi:hypothetical protein